MILLFGNKANKSFTSNKTNSINKSNPVENAGILAMGQMGSNSLLTVSEYDTFTSSNTTAVDYEMYGDVDYSDGSESFGFMSDFSSAVAVLGDCGYSSGSSDSGVASYSGSSCSSSSCSSFASFC